MDKLTFDDLVARAKQGSIAHKTPSALKPSEAKKEKRHISQMDAALQIAIQAWLVEEQVNLHGAELNTIAVQMVMGAKAGFAIAMVQYRGFEPTRFDD